MRKLTALAAAVSLFVLPAEASLPLTGAGMATPGAGGGGGGGGGSSYTGPGDVVGGATQFVGLRGYSNAVAASGTAKAANIRRASDSQTCDVLVASTGALGNTTACSGGAGSVSVASFCASTTCYVVRLYDQTGNGHDALQTTAGAQPQLILSCLGALPCMELAGSQYMAATLTNDAHAQSVSFVFRHAAAATVEEDIISWYNGGGPEAFQNSTAGYILLYGGSGGFVAAAEAAWHAAAYVQGDTYTSYAAADGSANSFTGSAMTVNSVEGIGQQNNSGANPWSGRLAEIIDYEGTGLTTTQLTSLCHNQYLYWGTPTAC